MLNQTTAQNENLFKTALDELFYSEYDEYPGPQVTSVDDPMIYRQSSTTKSAEITQVMNNVGSWEERAEGEKLSEATPFSSNNKTWVVANYAKSLPITDVAIEDDQWGMVGEQVREMGTFARWTQNNVAFGNFRNAFTTFITSNGTALISDSQSNLNGDTIDNKLTAALDVSSFKTAVNKLFHQKNQNGKVVGTPAQCLLVPGALFPDACEIVESELKPDTADNNMNVYSSKYGVYVKQHPLLGADAGGSDTAWFLLGKRHQLIRWVRKPVSTNFIPHHYSPEYVAYYRGQYREMYGAITYEGIVGSLGTA